MITVLIHRQGTNDYNSHSPASRQCNDHQLHVDSDSCLSIYYSQKVRSPIYRRQTPLNIKGLQFLDGFNFFLVTKNISTTVKKSTKRSLLNTRQKYPDLTKLDTFSLNQVKSPRVYYSRQQTDNFYQKVSLCLGPS